MRDADLRRLRRDLPCRSAYVGATQQQARGYFRDHRLLDGRQRPAHRSQLRHVARHAVPSSADSALRNRTRLRFLFRDGRQRAQVLRLRLLQVQLGFLAAAEQLLGDLEAALLDGDVLAGDLDPQQGRAIGVVEVRHLRAQQHLHVLLVGDGSEEAGFGRFDAAPEAAPEIQLPGEVEAGAEGAVVLVDVGAGAAALLLST